jgi:hypothetical protein
MRAGTSIAVKRWIRMSSNISLGAYEISVAEAPIPEPVWPDLPFREILKIAFGAGRLINSLDHPVMKRLRGA